jgi:hypothetical protein
MQVEEPIAIQATIRSSLERVKFDAKEDAAI